jgi:hypothetical protein
MVITLFPVGYFLYLINTINLILTYFTKIAVSLCSYIILKNVKYEHTFDMAIY